MKIATIKETAEYLRIGISTLYKKLAADKTMPRPFSLGGHPVFNLDSIDEWIAKQEQKAIKGDNHD